MPNKTPTPGTKKKGTRKKKNITAKEKLFAEFMVYEKMGAIQAYRMAFKVDCEPKSAAAQKAQNLAKSQRVVKEKFKLATQLDQEVTSQQVLLDTSDIEFDTLRQFIYRRLESIRDNPNEAGSARYKAIGALEKMVDPSADVNLIMMWVDLIWRASVAHCPCCHETFPMKDIKNKRLDQFRKDVEIDVDEGAETLFDRRMTVISRADNRKKPHPGQVIALAAPERNIAGLGPARSGKSYLLALFALLAFLIPGVEIWILARIYADAASEVEYLDKFLNTLFFPYTKHIITKRFDSKTEELTMESKWGSVLKIKSAKAKGSISGRELELALIAEPGWVPDDIFNHLRARMTSRLGRTILLGTPQGFGGILGRFTQMVTRDERGRQRRVPPSERTVAAGCPWNVSLLQYTLTPDQNPEYVASELAAAKQELTESEYASEFEGIMASSEGAMFPALSARNLVQIPRASQEDCAYVLGIDQGPKNFAACLLGFDSEKIWVVNEYFDNEPRMMKAKMEEVMDTVPGWIRQAGGDPKRWSLTIFDVDPPLLNELTVLEDEGNEWPTEYTFRTKDKKGRWNQENWRRETYEFVNRLSQSSPCKLYFDELNCDFLHDQLMRAQATGTEGKGWSIKDAVRQDHVADAFIMALFTILSGSMVIPDREFRVDDIYEDAAKAALFKLKEDERKELSGFTGNKDTSDKTFEKTFGRKRRKGGPMQPPSQWAYKDY